MSRFAERPWRPRTRKGPKGGRPRLAVECLEDRLTPAIVDFVPTAVVAVNPQLLPPQALILFMPEHPPQQVTPATGPRTGNVSFHLQGQLTESVPGGWLLDAVYALDGRATQTDMPGPAGADSLSATYVYEAHVTEVLVPPGPRQSPVWLFDNTDSGHGELSTDFLPVSKTAAAVAASFHDTTTISQTARKAGGEKQDWKVDATVASQGTLDGRDQATGSPLGRRRHEDVHIDRVLDATLTPIDASGNPGPASHVSEVAVTNLTGQDQFQSRDEGKLVRQLIDGHEFERVSFTFRGIEYEFQSDAGSFSDSWDAPE